MLEGKKILLGVCGSIASYKSATLTRLLVKAGANVKVIMTKDAAHFVSPLTFSTLSKNPVLSSYFKEDTGEWNSHVELGLWADLMLIAPASANTIAKFALGICDNLLTATYLSAKCPVYFAPAMDLDMWQHPSTKQNVAVLGNYGNIQINPGYGELASGLTGEGRMAEPEDIIRFLETSLSTALPLRGKRALVTAGPTYEAIDPVRFIGNHSSGKMGFAIAEELAKQGADVTLVSGPSALELKEKRIRRINVISSDEMAEAVEKHFTESNIAVMSAAVADYKPKYVSTEKIKKDSSEFGMELVKTTDILARAGQMKQAGQILIGFALETQNEEANAIKKLEKKNLDFIVLNSLNDEGAGFKGDTNKITIIDRYLNTERFPLKTKEDVAIDICKKITGLI
ncbi:bifunctional phosphopantothenoylcysteine decarboxylase/phosphopantothenate--cysteine ligase CoaBC [Arcticibacter tournemirensis]|uniref:Coenzyme A biosynthesis bifunctional protein CoaBC n=1 Tax=Arcticibacter tournemirensis TaxID=699437 RepID=A0A4Q0M8C1_9SPHI|nr:bifunctional phosphopantothenoylcysteine decarboxylase/phosphopantothenate--cysteine ligase CoaBC [Arcticibacter tournemirensis]RXF69285.1 bifunctional phosphopantothenoylcysteine decarboxylase/phosphopantothenate--cysteine ligase CoaBC [Arcticibacter tournemirensis]